MLLKILSFLLPWSLRRRALIRWFGYDIHPTARLGYAWVFPTKLIMAEKSRIDHFTVAIHLDLVQLDAEATIGRSNWITGFPSDSDSPHFRHQASTRRAELRLGKASAVTKNHHLDCTNSLTIGAFATVAGYNSQFLTHSINVLDNRQDSAPIHIGAYTFVGTNVVVLGGAVLPDYCVLGAKSLLNKAHTAEWTLYGGVPARAVSELPRTAAYFNRSEGFVY
ncbi:acyltransferase [Hymenobacter aerilatus]|uniref:Acyltransferase n=1 Tax=Hymenobacter aerilatus TaxID=2932251 RepID=A0A8T9SUT0_9BACT|nr:acyltransferase [Hymenobacter aerilatus]UOR04483.1 acyltransferase [Hymenobacter aerilatus]